MATKFFLSNDVISPPVSVPGENVEGLILTQPTGGGSNFTSTVTGPTSGVQIKAAGLDPYIWLTNPLAAVTITGTVTFNVWMSENNMSANAGADMLVERCDNAGAVISTIARSERGVELSVDTSSVVTTVNNWTATPTSTTLANGDRLRVTVFINDAGGTMASGFSVLTRWAAATPAAEGDSWVQFTETIALTVSDPPRVPNRLGLGLVMRGRS